MFNLEQSIAEWRRQMQAGGIKTPVPLEELECHLREEIEQLAGSGLPLGGAFGTAVQQIGQAQTIKTEFTKIERNSMRRLTFILIGIFAVLFGMAMVLPAMAWYRDHHAMPANHLTPLLIGLFIVASGLGTGIYGLKKRKA
jgi:drug/metabolite transporter (DMT)-like permease